MNVAQTYDDLADQYHLMFENWELSVERQAEAFELYSSPGLRSDHHMTTLIVLAALGHNRWG